MSTTKIALSKLRHCKRVAIHDVEWRKFIDYHKASASRDDNGYADLLPSLREDNIF